MKRTIQYFITLTFAVVIACGIQVKAALADSPCTVTSDQPCILEIKSNNSPYGVNIDPQKHLLVVYTNNSFRRRANFRFKNGNDVLDEVNLQATQSVLKHYTFDIPSSDLIERQFVISNKNNEGIDGTVFVVHADKQAHSDSL